MSRTSSCGSGSTFTPMCLCSAFFILDFIYLFLDRGKGREKERARNINAWLPLMHPPLGTWPVTQACALTGNRTGDLSIGRPVFNPLNHISQGTLSFLWISHESSRPVPPPPTLGSRSCLHNTELYHSPCAHLN